MVRFLFIFEKTTFFFIPIVATLCIMSIFFSSFIAIRQLDMKRIIAYSSIAHMNFAILGLFSLNYYGVIGGLLMMVSHGLVSSALFLLVGILYDRYHTRNILDYGGIVTVMPLFGTFFFLFIISNVSFPGTSNFVGEFIVLVGLANTPFKVIFILAALSLFFCMVYSLSILNRVTFGNLKSISIQKFKDINRREFSLLMVLFIINLAVGL